MNLSQHQYHFNGTVMASNKKRNYDDNYLDFGFTSITDKGVVKPQCVICHKILTAESLRPSKLRLHLETKHPQHVGKDRSFFSRQELNMKRQRLDASGSFHQQNAAVVEASFLVALEIAKKKKPHTIGEELILPCAKTMVKLVLGEKSAEKLNAISLSNNTVQRRISQISDDIREQVIQEIKRAGLFSIQLDESTDVQSCSQLLAFVRYVHDEDLKEEFLFCEPLEQSTKGEDVMQKLTEFFESEGLDWGNLCGICTDGAPAMLGSQSGFVTRVIQKHQMLSSSLHDPQRLCQDMDAAHETLLFHTAVRWLSKGNVVQRVFELREEISLFLRIQNKQDLLSAWSADSFEIRLAYLVDIFRQLNTLNLELQGKGSLIIDFVDKIKAFIRKMENWRRKVGMGNLAMLETVSEIVEKCDAATQNLITQHLEALEGEFKRYFPDIQSLTSRLVRAPFTAAVTCIPDDNDDGQTELLTLQEDSGAKMKFETESLTVFWSSMAASYPNLCDLAFRHLLPFSSTYSCEAAFSQLLHIKTKYRNRLEVKHDLRCALSETKPRIKKLVDNLQHHPSH
ncbi:zinc finger BED domain-containing protein 5-like [Portunus trituberculatus]|uniref:zinc finger BED domain-containing protein 5-like n=2 Tax=Portunus trituberculatus TaxID=210409 RepID=UPI001E1D1575|nr:zinc finger BED domain-containing protein 5-like [Portunus trituberculatus]XP_045114016.1 zinc finger BED domain-containing protein 5-like [Portunus trituberculatus]XP_045118156.1 zinc finger BED domain-containing protein 5-like [Portunus trituberculatus]